MSNDKLIEYIKADLDEVKKDVKSLLQFKWQLMGGTAVVSLVVGILIQLAIAVASK